MKLILPIFATFSLILGAYANDKEELPSCSDPLVRLSVAEIPCKEDPKLPIDFDIPELKVDFETLKKIYEGAESSGGHVVGPMNHPRRAIVLSPFPLEFICEARLLSDGGKSLSFLSLQKTILTETRYAGYLYSDQWTHYLTEENDLFPERKVKVSVAPNLEISNYSITLGYKKRTFRRAAGLVLNVCEANLGRSPIGSVAACSEVVKPVSTTVMKARLKTLTVNTEENLKIQKTLQVTCERRR